LGAPTGAGMIEVFDSRLHYLDRCRDRERQAADKAQTSEAKQIHQELAQRYEREARRIDR
jgi:hypothetical protein